MSITKRALLYQFFGSFQEKLDLFVDEYQQHNKNLDNIKQFMLIKNREAVENDILLRLSQSIINRWTLVNENSNNAIDNLFDAFEKFSKAPEGTLVDKLLRLLDPIIKNFVEFTFEDQQKMALVLCTAADRYAYSIEKTTIASKLSIVLSKYCRSVLKNSKTVSTDRNFEIPRVVLHYRDEKQKDYNHLVVELGCKVSTGTYDRNYFETEHQNKINKFDSNEEQFLRLIQAFIEVAGIVVKDDKIDVFAFWVSTLVAIFRPNTTLSQFLELLNPYIKIGSKCFEISVKQRNVCIVLNIVSNRVSVDKAELMSSEIVSFLSKILHENAHESSVLYALSCLSEFLLNKDVKEKISKEGDIIAALKHYQEYLELYTLQTIYISKFDYTRYQIGFLAQWCLETIGKSNNFKTKLIADSKSVVLNEIDLKSSLSLNACTPGIRISSDQLSVRSEQDNQRIRAHYPVTCGVFYYEVILLTSCQLVFGWTIKPDIESMFQSTDQATGFNGYSNGVYHQDRKCNTDNHTWQAGDVVGALIDVPNKIFSFYLNGQPIKYELNFKFSNEPYFAAALVTSFQQCYFNFGQVPFKHPPPSITYRTFHGSITKYVKDKLCPFCNQKRFSTRFTNCDHWKVCHECLTKLNKCPTCKLRSF